MPGRHLRFQRGNPEAPHPTPEDGCAELMMLLARRQLAALACEAERQGFTVGQLLRRLIATYLADRRGAGPGGEEQLTG